MDPFSLTAAVLSATFNCANAALKTHNFIRSCRDTPRLLSAVCNDCSMISFILSRMQLLMQQDDEYASARFQNPEVAERLTDALDACNTTLMELESKVSTVSEGEGTADMAWDRVRLAWSEIEIEKLSNHLRHHEMSLTVLLQVFQTEGIFRLEDVIVSVQATLSRHATILEQMAILLRRRGRMPQPSLSNLSLETNQMVDSVSNLILDATHTLLDDELAATRPHRRQANAAQESLDGANFRYPTYSTTSTWSKFIVDGVSTPIFHFYTDLLFDFITETWPAEGKIGYSQLREYAAYTAQPDQLPAESWVEENALLILNHTFSTEPLKNLFDFYEIEYEAEVVIRTHKIGIYGNPTDSIQTRSYEDISPILKREGWHQWLAATLRSNPTHWLLVQKHVIDNLPQKYRRRLPKGYIPREALPVSAQIKVANPFPLATASCHPQYEDIWNYIKQNCLFHNVYMYKDVKDIKFI